MIYRSKVDSWLYLILVLLAVMVISSLAPLLARGTWIDLLSGMGVIGLSLGLPLWMLLDTHYRIDEQTLTIRCGPFRWSIPRTEIESIEASQSPMSSPALSLDRLCIRYRRHRRVLVSPLDKDGFLRDLAHPESRPPRAEPEEPGSN